MNWLQDILSQVGYAFACSFWQMALLLAVYKLAAVVYLPVPADKFRFAFALTLTGSLWFLYTLAFSRPSAAWRGIAAFTGSQNIPGSLTAYFSQSLYWLGWAYLAMLGFSFLQGHIQWKAAFRIKAGGHEKAPVAWRLFVEKYAALLGIKQKVSLKISGNFSPATFGFFKPVILLPASCLTGLNNVQLEAILLHELAHIRRNDYLAAWVLQVANMLLYFNPFMRQLVQEARHECENACDDLVVQFQYDPVAYAHALLAVAKSGQQLSWALNAQGSRQHLLFNRIARLMGQPVEKKQFAWKTVLLPVAAILMISVAGLNYKNYNRLPAKMVMEISPVITSQPENAWQNSLLEARTAILAAATERAIANNQEKIARIQEKDAQDALSILAENAAIQTLPENPSSSLILSTNWAVDQNSPSENEANVKPEWQQFGEFLEKLETTGDLAENEWQQLAALISLYADIRNTIYAETARTQNFAGYAAETNVQQGPKILVLVHDEVTGLLCASLMDPAEINEAYSVENTPDNRQPVILLRKKAEAGKKIISL